MYTSASYQQLKSTESIEKIFEATMMSVSSFSSLLGHPYRVRSQTFFFLIDFNLKIILKDVRKAQLQKHLLGEDLGYN